tara:strand:+ start:4117 stop:4917 length:801 start_codon:yes stop_codon:yes gene_type:complete
MLLLAAGVLAAIVFFLLRDTGDPAPADTQAAPPVPAAPAAELPPAPDIPRQETPLPEPAPAEPAGDEPAPPPELPTGEEADALLMDTLEEASVGTRLRELLQVEHPLDVSVAMIDWMAQGVVPRKLLALPAPGEFPVAESDGQLLMGDAAYARYDSLASAAAAADTGALAAGFHKMRPLLERAYGQLGLEEDKFDNAVIRTLDQVLATPEIEEPIPLVRKSVMYTYADPELESLAGLQKQLLRMGPDNLRIIKQQARALREQLLAQ